MAPGRGKSASSSDGDTIGYGHILTSSSRSSAPRGAASGDLSGTVSSRGRSTYFSSSNENFLTAQSSFTLSACVELVG